jgi:hypothetical protein
MASSHKTIPQMAIASPGLWALEFLTNQDSYNHLLGTAPCLAIWKPSRPSPFFFLYTGVWAHVCCTSTVPFESCAWSLWFFFFFSQIGSCTNFCQDPPTSAFQVVPPHPACFWDGVSLTYVRDSLELCLSCLCHLSSWDFRCELPCPVSFVGFIEASLCSYDW